MQQAPNRRQTALALAVGAGVVLIGLALIGLGLGGNGSAAGFAAAPVNNAVGPGAPRLASFVLSNAPGPSSTRPSTTATRFSASTDNELYAHMVWANVGGTYDAYLTFLTPNSETYQVLDVPFTTGPAPAGAQSISQQRPGLLHPVTVQVAVPNSGGGYQVVGQLPIAGTWISRLLGTWKVEVRLGTDPTVLGGQTFTFTR